MLADVAELEVCQKLAMGVIINGRFYDSSGFSISTSVLVMLSAEIDTELMYFGL